MGNEELVVALAKGLHKATYPDLAWDKRLRRCKYFLRLARLEVMIDKGQETLAAVRADLAPYGAQREPLAQMAARFGITLRSP